MKIQPPWPGILALWLAILLAFQGCSYLMKPSLMQDVPVTSVPAGATVLVDGKVVGRSPMVLTLKKKRKHAVRIEMAGYNPVELRFRRNVTPRAGLEALAVPLAAVSMGLAASLIRIIATDADKSLGSYNRTYATVFWITCAAGTAGWAAEMASGANYRLSPRTLDVTLTKAEGPGPHRVDIVELDADEIKNVRWIRIRPRV